MHKQNKENFKLQLFFRTKSKGILLSILPLRQLALNLLVTGLRAQTIATSGVEEKL